MGIAKRYEFEGEQLTLKEIALCVPALPITTIELRVKAGMTTRQQMLTYDTAAARRAAGRRGRASTGNKLPSVSGKP